MKTIKRLFGMAWATPVVRTGVQAVVGAVLASFVADGNVKLALSAGLAAGLAKLQAAVR